MSKPRYDWWGYVKGMIRRYPELCAKEKELKECRISPALESIPHGKGKTSNPTANAALRELPEINRREKAAVEKAIDETVKLETGEERMKMVRMVLWDHTHTIAGAARELNRCERTLAQWHGEFIRLVADCFGLL